MRAAWGLLSLAVLGADQLTKAMIVSRLAVHASVQVVPGFFNLTLVTNRGALFGMLHDLPDPHRAVLFTAVPALAVALVLLFQWRTAPDDRLAQAALALILGGAAGNLGDRIRLGHVIDFLDVYVGTRHWPAFNVADSAICVGVGLLLYDMVSRSRRTAAAPEA